MSVSMKNYVDYPSNLMNILLHNFLLLNQKIVHLNIHYF